MKPSNNIDSSLLLGFGEKPHGNLVHSLQKPKISHPSSLRSGTISKVKMFLEEASRNDEVLHSIDPVCLEAEGEPLSKDENSFIDNNKTLKNSENLSFQNINQFYNDENLQDNDETLENLAIEMNLALGVFEESKILDEEDQVKAYSNLLQVLMGSGSEEYSESSSSSSIQEIDNEDEMKN